MKTIILFLVIVPMFFSQSFGATLAFEEVWKNYLLNSHEMQSAREEKTAAGLALERGKLHWTPRVSLLGQVSDTNDPGQVLFNQLGQRSVAPPDFVPSNLNDPDRKQFVSGVIRLELPLYEGGMKINQLSMLRKTEQSADAGIRAIETERYADFSRQYGSLLIYKHKLHSLNDLKKEIDKIINSYQVGSASNPLGRMGLLGLKSVATRIEGIFLNFQQQANNHKDWIAQKSNLENWEMKESQFGEYLDKNLPIEDRSGHSSAIESQELKVEALKLMPEMEKARYRPQVGLFAQNQLYSGDRDTESAQTIGVYLKWELFNSDNYNRAGEARSIAIAREAKLQAGKLDETIARDSLLTSNMTLRKSLNLTGESAEYLHEQSKNSIKLFRAGLMNGLQLSEVINRRVDVIEQEKNIELQYLDVRSRLYQLTH